MHHVVREDYIVTISLTIYTTLTQVYLSVIHCNRIYSINFNDLENENFKINSTFAK